MAHCSIHPPLYEGTPASAVLHLVIRYLDHLAEGLLDHNSLYCCARRKIANSTIQLTRQRPIDIKILYGKILDRVLSSQKQRDLVSDALRCRYWKGIAVSPTPSIEEGTGKSWFSQFVELPVE